MYAFTSSPQRGILHVLTIACFVLAFLLFGISGTEGIAYPLIYQLSAIPLFVAGIYFLSRYVLKQYRYELTQSSICDALGHPLLELVITETTGRRSAVVARVALRDVTHAEIIDTRKDKKAAQEKIDFLKRKASGGISTNRTHASEKAVVFRYLNTPLVTCACHVVVPSEGSLLVIPPDERMCHLLRQAGQNGGFFEGQAGTSDI